MRRLRYAAIVATFDPSENLEPAPPARVPETITGSLACMTCLYRLTGLPMSGVCPECSTPALSSYRGVYDASVIERRGLAKRLRRAQFALIGLVISLVAAWLSVLLPSRFGGLSGIGVAACWMWWLAEWICLFLPVKGLAESDTGSRHGQIISIGLIVASVACPLVLCTGLAPTQIHFTVMMLGFLTLLTVHQHLALRRIRSFGALIEADGNTSYSAWTARAMNGLAILYVLSVPLWNLIGPVQPLGANMMLGWYPAISLTCWLVVLERLRRRVKRLLPRYLSGTA